MPDIIQHQQSPPVDPCVMTEDPESDLELTLSLIPIRTELCADCDTDQGD